MICDENMMCSAQGARSRFSSGRIDSPAKLPEFTEELGWMQYHKESVIHSGIPHKIRSESLNGFLRSLGFVSKLEHFLLPAFYSNQDKPHSA